MSTFMSLNRTIKNIFHNKSNDTFFYIKHVSIFYLDVIKVELFDSSRRESCILCGTEGV